MPLYLKLPLLGQGWMDAMFWRLHVPLQVHVLNTWLLACGISLKVVDPLEAEIWSAEPGMWEFKGYSLPLFLDYLSYCWFILCEQLLPHSLIGMMEPFLFLTFTSMMEWNPFETMSQNETFFLKWLLLCIFATVVRKVTSTMIIPSAGTPLANGFIPLYSQTSFLKIYF